MSQSPKPLLLTVREVSKLLRIHRPKVYDLIRAGTIDGFKLGSDWRVRTESVEKLIGSIPEDFFDKAKLVNGAADAHDDDDADAHAIDKADGAGTILFDLAARDWSDELLTALELDRSILPTTFEGPEITGSLTAAAADATGLRAGTPVVAGISAANLALRAAQLLARGAETGPAQALYLRAPDITPSAGPKRVTG